MLLISSSGKQAYRYDRPISTTVNSITHTRLSNEGAQLSTCLEDLDMVCGGGTTFIANSTYMKDPQDQASPANSGAVERLSFLHPECKSTGVTRDNKSLARSSERCRRILRTADLSWLSADRAG